MATGTTASRRIVIADNDPEVLELLANDLRAEGHDVVGTATSGSDALDLCRRLHPDVLIVDFRMPGGPDGIEVTRRLRADDSAVEVILYTNYRRMDLQQRAARLGATFLAKGNIRALRRAIAATVARPASD